MYSYSVFYSHLQALLSAIEKLMVVDKFSSILLCLVSVTLLHSCIARYWVIHHQFLEEFL